ncbi:MAG: DUF4870 domain-containing protein [Chthoniobacterales bacterium]
MPAPSNQPSTVSPGPSTDNSLAVAMQLLGFAGFVFPFGNILAPLILWLVKRSASPYLDRVGKDVLNFQISYTVYIAVSVGVGFALLFVLVGILFFLLAGFVWILWVVLMVVAAVKTSNGEDYKYPFTIRLLQ